MTLDRIGVATSRDGVPIHYEMRGEGKLALVLVHGWCCDGRYWRRQVEHFSTDYGVVCIDLAGHGKSGHERKQYTISAFAQDVVAVVEHLLLDRVVLIGHSMSGGVVVEAARHLATKVIGLVGVDSMWNVEQERSPEQIAAFIAPFHTNFPKAARSFVRGMFTPKFDTASAEEIMSAVAATPSALGVQALEASMGNSRNLLEGVEEIGLPISLINSPHWQVTNVEAARRHGIEVTLMPGVGHFLMLEDPHTFNQLLQVAVQRFQ